MQKGGCNLEKALLYCSHITGKGARKMKRIISLMLSLIIILSLVSGAAISVSAASNMSTSTMGINMIKSFEGFSQWPHEDNGQWTVGYGTGVTGAKLEEYKTNGITESQATELLAEYLETFEVAVNNFIDTHNLKLYQHQFDALVSFTYNVGTNWMQETTGTFYSAVINGKTGNDFIFAMAQFGKASGSVVGGLVQRRLCEANLYLNGAYTTTPPANYKYVEYKANIAGAIPTVTIQGYDTTKSVAPKATISKDGYRFMGWYTKETGGDWVTTLGSGTAGVVKLYAHWQEGDGPKNTDGSIKGTALTLTGYMPASADHNVYDAPNGTKKSTVKGDAKLSVTAEYVDSNGKKWGKVSNGWIVITGGLSSIPVYEEAGSAIDPITVTVTTGGVNNRVGPGTNYAKQGTYKKGQLLTLTAIQKGGNYTWGKSDEGWIALQYTDYETKKVTASEDAKKVTAVGTIIRSDYVNVRAGAGTSHAKVGVYYRNDEIKISLRQKVGNITWGLTEKGWVSLYYVKLTEVEAGSVEDMNFSNGTTGSTGSSSGTTGGTPTTNGGSVVATGIIYNCTTLRIRSGAGTSNAHIGDYPAGTVVNIYETASAKSDVWGRTDRGWISMRYVKLDAPTTGVGITGRVHRTNTLNVRSGAGTHFPKVTSLKKDTKVEIVEYTKVGNATWGRTHEGWVSLYYIKLDAPLSDLDGVTTPVVPEATEPEATEPEATKYTITVGSMTNGKVAASASSAAAGTEVALTITPNAGYVLNTLSVKDASNATITVVNNKFTMPEGNVTITATFKAQYNVKIQSATGGKVTANTTACDAGTKIMLTVTPNAGYALKTLTYVNTATNAVTELYNDATSAYIKNSFTMPAADVNVVATFKQSTAATHNVKVNGAENGEVAANVSSAKAGETVIISVNPAADHILKALSVRTSENKVVAVAEVEKNIYSFVMPEFDVTVSASFKREAFDVNIASVTGGTVAIAEPGTYKKGETVTLTVAAKADYKFKSLSVKSGDTVIETKNNGATYTFTMPAAEVEVKATFEAILYDLTIATASNGTVKTADNKTSYVKGTNVELVIEPAVGYELEAVIVKDTANKVLSVSGNKFEMPSGGASVSVTFKKSTYNVNVNAVDGVLIKAGKETAQMGDDVTLEVTESAGYKVTKITFTGADGKEVEIKDNKFTMPASNVTITAVVEKIPYTVDIKKDPNINYFNGVNVSLKTNRQYTVGETVELVVRNDFLNYGFTMKLTAKDAAGNELEVKDNKFTMPASDVEINYTLNFPRFP